MSKKINCKTHDDKEVITHVGIVGEGIREMEVVWSRISVGEEFHTYENNKMAKVYARERGGTKYLTSHPDGETPNNLDELSACS